MEGLFSDPRVVAFLVSYFAGVTLDVTKASFKGMAGLFRRTGDHEIAKKFEGLRREEQLRRSCQHLINEVLKPLPEKQKDQVVSDADLLAELVCGFLTKPQAGKPPITQQLRVAILEHVELPDGADEAAIASVTATVVLAIARDDIANVILLGAVEQVQSTVNVGFETQAAESNALKSMLSTALQD
ncbi:MAG: hypothetical protein IID18_09055, partial [Nitrospinae bacterium]|nr:hypothetical protein [Nitrospinota bacterium]